MFAPGGVLARGGIDALRHAATGPAVGLVEWLRPDADARRLGASRARDIVANALLPTLTLDGEQREDPSVLPHVVRLARELPAPSDRRVRAYAKAGIRAAHALDALGIHALADGLCAEGRCARCAVGQRLAPALSGESG